MNEEEPACHAGDNHRVIYVEKEEKKTLAFRDRLSSMFSFQLVSVFF